jgi:hypothetical protein
MDSSTSEPKIDPTGQFCTDLTCVTELSGIYYISPDKTHDSLYNATEKKIPDPVIRTAIIGE